MVSLIEKCTRFHIHCAHHLCEEPMSSFDAKINNENMTKCLQSLKEMYQDLANKGIYCKSEAEFRGYNVLLNLNKGDILRWEQDISCFLSLPLGRIGFGIKSRQIVMHLMLILRCCRLLLNCDCSILKQKFCPCLLSPQRSSAISSRG